MNENTTIEYTLVLNASEGVLQIVVGSQAKLLAHQEWDCPKNSTEKLVPLLDEIFKKLDLSFSSLTRIACVVGAGSFTGIRLSLVTAAALARVHNIKQVPIDFLHALSYNAPTNKGTHTRVITHAKKNLVHCADFISDSNNIPVQQGKTLLLEPKDIFYAPLPHYLLGSGTAKLESIEKNENCIILAPSANILNPQVLLGLANSLPVEVKDIKAEYVRTCDAVDNLKHISQQLGNNTDCAFKKYEEIIRRFEP